MNEPHHLDKRLRLKTAAQNDATGCLNPLEVAIDDWGAWLGLSTTPETLPGYDPMRRLHVRDGIVTASQEWPDTAGARIYVAYDHQGAVYVGQTNRPLLTRVRRHFGAQRTSQERLKAGTWQFVVTALFNNLSANRLDECERSAADWLLPHRHRAGRRHPLAPP